MASYAGSPVPCVPLEATASSGRSTDHSQGMRSSLDATLSHGSTDVGKKDSQGPGVSPLHSEFQGVSAPQLLNCVCV